MADAPLFSEGVIMKDVFEKRATKAVAIARVSTEDQKLGYSLDAQSFRLQEYCQRHGLELVKTFEIVESSTTGERKEFHAAINFASKQKERYAIITDKVDRLQRRLSETPLLEKLISEGKIELHFHVENVQIHKNSTSQERLMWNLHVILAQSYVDSLRDNVNRSIEQKLRKGEWISHAPVGYLHIAANDNQRGGSRIVVDPLRGPLVRDLFEAYSSGIYTLGELTFKAKELGLTNHAGLGKYFSKAHIHRMLQNPFYYGIMKVKKTGREYPHIYEPLISKELFDRCHAVRKGWNKKPFKYGEKEFLFRGLITCAVTGRMVSADTKQRKRADGTAYETTYLGTWNPEDLSKKIWVREDDVIARVEEVFKRLKLSEEAFAEVIEYVRDGAADERKYYKAKIEALVREQALIKSKLDTLMDFWLEGKITEEEHNDKRTNLLKRRDDILKEIAAHNLGDDNFSTCMQDIIKVCANAFYWFQLSNVEGKRRFVNLIFSTIKLRGKNLEFTIRPPFDKFIKTVEIEDWWRLIDTFRQDWEKRSIVVQLTTSPDFPFFLDFVNNTGMGEKVTVRKFIPNVEGQN